CGRSALFWRGVKMVADMEAARVQYHELLGAMMGDDRDRDRKAASPERGRLRAKKLVRSPPSMCSTAVSSSCTSSGRMSSTNTASSLKWDEQVNQWAQSIPSGSRLSTPAKAPIDSAPASDHDWQAVDLESPSYTPPRTLRNAKVHPYSSSSNGSTAQFPVASPPSSLADFEPLEKEKAAHPSSADAAQTRSKALHRRHDTDSHYEDLVSELHRLSQSMPGAFVPGSSYPELGVAILSPTLLKSTTAQCKRLVPSCNQTAASSSAQSSVHCSVQGSVQCDVKSPVGLSLPAPTEKLPSHLPTLAASRSAAATEATEGKWQQREDGYLKAGIERGERSARRDIQKAERADCKTLEKTWRQLATSDRIQLRSADLSRDDAQHQQQLHREQPDSRRPSIEPNRQQPDNGQPSIQSCASLERDEHHARELISSAEHFETEEFATGSPFRLQAEAKAEAEQSSLLSELTRQRQEDAESEAAEETKRKVWEVVREAVWEEQVVRGFLLSDETREATGLFDHIKFFLDTFARDPESHPLTAEKDEREARTVLEALESTSFASHIRVPDLESLEQIRRAWVDRDQVNSLCPVQQSADDSLALAQHQTSETMQRRLLAKDEAVRRSIAEADISAGFLMMLDRMAWLVNCRYVPHTHNQRLPQVSYENSARRPR
ncbi:hypothetical protein DIPPA_27370, partial [Diplonema papillatum]